MPPARYEGVDPMNTGCTTVESVGVISVIEKAVEACSMLLPPITTMTCTPPLTEGRGSQNIDKPAPPLATTPTERAEQGWMTVRFFICSRRLLEASSLSRLYIFQHPL